jgi:hypothetical protein
VIVVASITQRTSDEKTFYYMTAMVNRRPLQVSEIGSEVKKLNWQAFE